jgi:cell division protein FtsB
MMTDAATVLSLLCRLEQSVQAAEQTIAAQQQQITTLAAEVARLSAEREGVT